MKFPHLNLLFFIALLSLMSCDKEMAAAPNPELSHDAALGTRCCTDAVGDMIEDPRFADFYDSFVNGVFDPALAILDQFDIDELDNEIVAFNDCIDSGSSFDFCIEQSEVLGRLLTIINSFDLDLLVELQNKFDYLDQDEFNTVLIEAVNQTAQDSGHNLQCFLQFRADMIDVFALVGVTSLATGGGAGIALVFGIIKARTKYCNCLYTNYGAQC